MANTLITPSLIAKEALMQLENNLVMGNLVHRAYQKEFKGGQGDRVSIRKPVKFFTSDGANRVNQDVVESTTDIRIDQRKHVSWKFSSEDMTLSVQNYSERYIKPAMITLANTIDKSLFNLYKNVWNAVGTPGTTPSNYAAVGAAAQRMDEMSVPSDHRYLVVNPAAGYALAADKMTLDAIGSSAKSAYTDAQIGRTAKFDIFSSQNIATHATGSRKDEIKIISYDRDGQNGDVILASGLEPGKIKGVLAGDVIQISDVNAVNPVPGEGGAGKTAMPYQQQFTLLSSEGTNTNGQVSMKLSPSVIEAGAYQNATRLPKAGDTITIMGAKNSISPQNLAFHKNAFALVTVPLETPDGAAFSSREHHKGLSVRVVKDYNIDTDDNVIRLDVLYGVKTIYPELACRLWG